jgi:hypothetical protein
VLLLKKAEVLLARDELEQVEVELRRMHQRIALLLYCISVAYCISIALLHHCKHCGGAAAARCVCVCVCVYVSYIEHAQKTRANRSMA